MKKIILMLFIGIISLSADYKMVLTDLDGNQTSECVKSYSFSNNLESIANEKSLVKDIYSEEETLTNKMYLGKPVYRKVYTFDDYTVPVGASGVYKYTEVVSEDIDKIIDLNIKAYVDDQLYSEGNSRYVYYGRTDSVAMWSSYFKSTKQAYVYIRNQRSASNPWSITDLRLTIEYTKTTNGGNTSESTFKSYIHYLPSLSTTGEVITKDMENLGIQLLKGYSYDSSTNSCTKN